MMRSLSVVRRPIVTVVRTRSASDTRCVWILDRFRFELEIVGLEVIWRIEIVLDGC